MITNFILSFLLIFCCNLYAFENNNFYFDAKNEIFLNESKWECINRIVTNQEGVFLYIGDCWLVTEGLQMTQEGLFVLVHECWMPIDQALKISERIRGAWQCSKCGFDNYDGISACAVCGKPKNA